MIQIILTWITAAAFTGAGIYNSLGKSATKVDYVRWGYPAWWCYITGVSELVTAALIAVPTTRVVGMTLGAVIIAAALVTIARRREFAHLPPLGVFAGLLVATALLRTA